MSRSARLLLAVGTLAFGGCSGNCCPRPCPCAPPPCGVPAAPAVAAVEAAFHSEKGAPAVFVAVLKSGADRMIIVVDPVTGVVREGPRKADADDDEDEKDEKGEKGEHPSKPGA